MVCRPGQRGPDQVVEPARFIGGHHHRAARPHQLADQAGRQVGGAAAQGGRQPVHADQAQPPLLEEHEPARVRPGQLAQAGGDAVEHRLQVPLGGHVRDDVPELADHPGALRHVVPGRLLRPGPVADVHPADDLPGRVAQRADVDAQVEQGAVLAGAAGGEGDLAAGADAFQHRVVLGRQLLRDDRRLGAEDFLRGPAEHALGGRVPEQDGAVRAERHDRVGRALHDRARRRVHPVPAGDRPLLCHGFIVPLSGRSIPARHKVAGCGLRAPPPPGATGPAMPARRRWHRWRSAGRCRWRWRSPGRPGTAPTAG